VGSRPRARYRAKLLEEYREEARGGHDRDGRPQRDWRGGEPDRPPAGSSGRSGEISTEDGPADAGP